jgi:hypothetical protein
MIHPRGICVIYAILFFLASAWHIRGQGLERNLDEGLQRTLSTHANSKKQIAISFTNSGYLHFALNWLYYVREAGIDNYVIFALDDAAYASLRREKAHVFYDPSLDQVHLIPLPVLAFCALRTPELHIVLAEDFPRSSLRFLLKNE